MKDFDTFTKITYKVGDLGKILLPQALKSCPKCNKSPNLVTLIENNDNKQKEAVIVPWKKHLNKKCLMARRGVACRCKISHNFEILFHLFSTSIICLQISS